MEDLEGHLHQAEEERSEKTTMLLDAYLRSNTHVQQLQEKLACVERKADKRQHKTLIEIEYLQASTEVKDALVAELREKDRSC